MGRPRAQAALGSGAVGGGREARRFGDIRWVDFGIWKSGLIARFFIPFSVLLF